MREWLVLGAAVLIVAGSPRPLVADQLAYNPPSPRGATDHRDSGGTRAMADEPSYSPPLRGSPNNRVSGGTRGLTADLLKLDALAPQRVGQTVKEQPTLYWYNSKPIASAVEVTLVADQSSKTVLKVTVPGPLPAGINGFRLADTKVRLDPNVDYQWSVAVVASTAERPRNAFASGMIRRVMRLEPIPASGADGGAAAYAAAGLWYDAFEIVSKAIDRTPADRQLRERRSRLLEQAGLPDAAEFDRRSGS
jgi:uncharacterized protein DUF928